MALKPCPSLATMPEVARNRGKIPGPFLPTSGMILYASRNGCSLDSSLRGGGGTDDTAAIQSLLDLGQASPVEVVIDGVALAGGLKIYSGSTLRGLGPGSGLSWRGSGVSGGTESCVIRNAHWRSPYQGAAIVDQNITIRDLEIDGGKTRGANGGSFPQGNPNGQWCSPIQLFGVKALRIENVSIYDPVTYGIHVANVDHGTFRNLRVTDPVWAATGGGGFVDGRNTDGLHLNGPCSDILIDGLMGTTADDFLALNAADGNLDTSISNTSGPQIYGGFSSVYFGDIVRVFARNLYPYQSYNVARCLVGNDPRGGSTACNIDDLSIEGVAGSVVYSAMRGESFPGAGTGGVKKRVRLAGWQLDQAGNVAFNGFGFCLGGQWDDVEIAGQQLRDIVGNSSCLQLNLASDASVGRLKVGVAIREDGSEASNPLPPISITQGSVDELIVSDSSWHRAATTSQSLISISGGTVGLLATEGITTNNLAHVASITGGTVGAVTMAGTTMRGSQTSGLAISGTTLPRLRASGSNLSVLASGAAPTSIKTDGTEDA